MNGVIGCSLPHSNLPQIQGRKGKGDTPKPKNYVFRPNAHKTNAWFVKFLEKYEKIMHFRNFLKKYFENFLSIQNKLSFSRFSNFVELDRAFLLRA